MTCHQFRASFSPRTEDAAELAHIRSCDACLDYAASVDADVIFRAIGGDEIVPPGGLDAFVGDVMREVRLRSTETVARPDQHWGRRLALAAAISVGISGASLFLIRETRPAMQLPIARAAIQTAAGTGASTRPVVESYEAQNATIVEVPTEGAGDVKVVMIFDESLPKDL